MKYAVLLMAALMGGVVVGPAALAGDCSGCAKIAESGTGWCDGCKGGAVFGVEVKSDKLYNALAGKTVEAGKLQCSGCKTAADKGESCDHCKTYFHDGKVYQSFVSYALAKGKAVDAGEMKCGGCKSAHDATSGQRTCSACDVGFVGKLAYHGKSAIESARKAMGILVKAAGATSHCDACAVGMVTNGQCDHCKYKFEDGKSKKM